MPVGREGSYSSTLYAISTMHGLTNMKHGHLILINGASSAGKTSTCEAFQNLSEELYVKLGIDKFWLAIPSKQLKIMQATSEFYQTSTYYRDGKPYFHITPGPSLDAVIYASYKAIASYLKEGINVISDQIFWKPEWFRAALKDFNPYQVFFVGLFVADDEGARREQQRDQENARAEGWSRCSALVTHTNMEYDIEIDNTNLSIDETAKKLLSLVRSCKNPMAFKKMLAKIEN